MAKIRIGDYEFEGVFTDTNRIGSKSGVYVILHTRLSNSEIPGHSVITPDDDVIIDIGESHDIKKRIEHHDRKECWENERQDGGYGYAVYYCDEINRERIEKELREKYNPPCGKR